MRILLIRHAESTGNARRLWAGITDHPVTIHGNAQAQALANALSSVPLTHIYTSPLRRALHTAKAVKKFHPGAAWVVCEELVEQNLGSCEGKPWKPGSGSSDGESTSEIRQRAQRFVETTLKNIEQDSCVAIVSHGLFLSVLASAMRTAPGIWSNTGYMDIEIFANGNCITKRSNETGHLVGLKRARAGIGSEAYDTRQRNIGDYFGSRSKYTTDTLNMVINK